jgi:hypothetical protein
VHRTRHDNDIGGHQFAFEKVNISIGIDAGVVIPALAAAQTAAFYIQVMEVDHLN